MNVAVFWVVALCNVVQVYRRFIGAGCSIMRAMALIKLKELKSTRHKDPEDSPNNRHCDLLFVFTYRIMLFAT
jgi:uncharacterized protein YhhL (DUF1145 family)